MDEGRVRALSGNALFAYELPSPTSCHSSELRSATRSAKDRHVFTHIQRSTYHSTPCLRGNRITSSLQEAYTLIPSLCVYLSAFSSIALFPLETLPNGVAM